MTHKEKQIGVEEYVDYWNESHRKLREKRVHRKEEIQELTHYGMVFLVDNLVNPQKGDFILELGCGEGERLKNYEKICSVRGIDISQKMLEQATRNLSKGKVIFANMENLPFEDEVFDKVVAVYSMVYSPNKLKVMKEVSRVLKQNGEFIVYEPNKISLKVLQSFLASVKLSISGEKTKALHHKILIRKSLSYLQFKKLGSKANLNISYWRGHFSYHLALLAINNNILTDITLFIFKILLYRKWGTIPIVKFFSDFLIIKFVKEKTK